MSENEFLLSKLQERILLLDFCFLRNENTSTWRKRTIVLTNKGIYFLIPAKNQCSLCPPENFCPKGPSFDFSIEYEKVIKHDLLIL